MNKIVFRGAVILCILFCIPFLITLITNKNMEKEDKTQFNTGIYVYVNEGDNVLAMDLDEYLIGVVAGSMPVDYEPEALKAQAVVSRTYALNIIGERKRVESSELNQAYKSVGAMKENFGSDFDENYHKIMQAVLDTTEEKLCYDDKLISAVFFRCSNGNTRNASDVWGSELPYLVSVESPWDLESSDYEKQTTFSLEDCINLMQKSYREFQASPMGLGDSIQVIGKDDSGYITEIQMGNMTFTGEELRYALGLESGCFTVKTKSNSIIFTTYGSGHGVGMSQNGANAMAKEGSKYEEILSYYYTGTTIK